MINENAGRTVQRVRHALVKRRLRIAAVSWLTPKMRRITLHSPELNGFISPGFDDHIKLFLPSGPMRDYTPRPDIAANVLHIDFAIHAAGPATAWALRAAVGDEVEIGGPRGSMLIPLEFDWHLLIGDETGLPAIGRRLAQLPPEARALVFVEIDDEAERQTLATRANVDLRWVYRRGSTAGGSEQLLRALREGPWPSGDYFAWAAAESSVVRTIRRVLLGERSANRDWIKTAGYWRGGAEAVHDKIED